MKSPEYIAHGTTSKIDADNIVEDGFEAEEGRATVSTDLIMAMNWASNTEKRKASRSESEVHEQERGRIIIMKVPENNVADYGVDTDIKVDDASKEVSGFVSRYENGRRYLALYNKKGGSKDIKIPKENILMSIVPSDELYDVLSTLKKSISNLETIDIDDISAVILDIIMKDSSNILPQNFNPKEIIGSLVVSTIESEVMRLIRTLSLDVKRAKAYDITNKGSVDRKLVSPDGMKTRMRAIQTIVGNEDFDIGSENLTRYIKINVNNLARELES